MMALAATQALFRSVIRGASAAPLVPLIADGKTARARLEIYRRHQRVSFTRVILTKYPATHWLIGDLAMREAAETYAARTLPEGPCLADYGQSFPDWLDALHASDRAYVGDVARLEQALGKAALDIECEPLPIGALAGLDEAALVAAKLNLQPGVAYLRLAWPADRLVEIFLSGAPPERLEIEALDTGLEIRGARGTTGMRRLPASAFLFRAAIARGDSLESASTAALLADESFNPAAALTELFSERLVTGFSAGESL